MKHSLKLKCRVKLGCVEEIKEYADRSLLLLSLQWQLAAVKREKKKNSGSERPAELCVWKLLVLAVSSRKKKEAKETLI